MSAVPAAATRVTHTYPGSLDQVPLARHAVERDLAECPAVDDAALIASELAANAVLHSRSRGDTFTVRTELHPDHVRVEVEDHGGPWRARPSDGRAHGQDMVAALTSRDAWGAEITSDGGRVIWARLELPPGE